MYELSKNIYMRYTLLSISHISIYYLYILPHLLNANPHGQLITSKIQGTIRFHLFQSCVKRLGTIPSVLI